MHHLLILHSSRRCAPETLHSNWTSSRARTAFRKRASPANVLDFRFITVSGALALGETPIRQDCLLIRNLHLERPSSSPGRGALTQPRVRACRRTTLGANARRFAPGN
eukprot:1660497-Prymnesium_polylepis.1